MQKEQPLRFSVDLLKAYRESASQNAHELHSEAQILFRHSAFARAYFLAVSSIEEPGKSLMAFDMQKRNLSDPAVCSKFKRMTENHGQKINYALSLWALNSEDKRAALEAASEIIIDVKYGREPSMYSALKTGPDKVELPREKVTQTAAKDCIRLSNDALAYSHHHFQTREPYPFSNIHDRLFTMKEAKLQVVLSEEGFWRFYIEKLEVGETDFAKVVNDYCHLTMKLEK